MGEEVKKARKNRFLFLLIISVAFFVFLIIPPKKLRHSSAPNTQPTKEPARFKEYQEATQEFALLSIIIKAVAYLATGAANLE